MIREGREVRSWTDYILRIDHLLFWNMSVRDPSPGLPLQRLPEGEIQVPWGAQADPPPTTNHPDEGGRNICDPT